MATGEARIVLVGVGGLGSASALALARGGVGELVLVDPDRVEPSNLARQVIYRMDDLGRPKAEAAAERLGASFPGLRLQQRPEPFTAENASRLLGGAAMVVDGLDSFASRTVLSDAAQAAGIPMVHAGVLRFGGQAMTILPGRSTCYRCLMPEPPPPDVAPDPAEEGVLGPVVGLFGALQAREALLLLAGQQPCLVDRLWVADLLGGTSQLLRLVRDGRCPGCGPGRQPWCAVDEAERRDVVQPAPRRRRAAPGGAPARSRGAGERRESGLTPEATGRYQRQLRLREVGEAGQRRLGHSTVELHGVGASAWTAALYLVAAGVGQVRLVGGSWSEAQLGDLRRLNPDVVVERAAAGETGTAADGAQLLALDTGAAGLLPPELGEPTAEMRGAAAATQALLTLLELIPRPSPSAGRAGELLFQSRR